MDQHFVPHPALYGIVSPPAPQTPPPVRKVAAPYQQLKDLDELLDLQQAKVSQARSSYSKTLEQFAILCHELWQQEKAQGNRQGKGFRRQLEEAGIHAARAYRAMKKFFPADFPARKKPRSATSSAANKVANRMPFLRFMRQSKIPACPGRAGAASQVLELALALTPQEKTEFLRCLKVVGAGQLPQLLLQAMKQAAEAVRTGQQGPVEELAKEKVAPARKPPRPDYDHGHGSLPLRPQRSRARTSTRSTQGTANRAGP
jgi:hypothetical protein